MLSFAVLAVRNLYPPNRSWFWPSPCPKQTRQTRHGGTPFGGCRCTLYGAGVSPETLRASPSTCRVLTIDWHVRGLYRCLWYARGLCLCPCATMITPGGPGLLPSQHKRWSIVFRFLFQQNKHTNNTYIFQGVPFNFCTDIHPGVGCWRLAKGTTFPQKKIFVPQTPTWRHMWKCPRRHEEKKEKKYNHLRPLNYQNTKKSLYLDLQTPGINSAERDVDETFTLLLLITLLP